RRSGGGQAALDLPEVGRQVRSRRTEAPIVRKISRRRGEDRRSRSRKTQANAIPRFSRCASSQVEWNSASFHPYFRKNAVPSSGANWKRACPEARADPKVFWRRFMRSGEPRS